MKLRDWFRSHSEIKAGDKIKINEIVTGKKYRLKAVK
jgi:hypothetical protein